MTQNLTHSLLRPALLLSFLSFPAALPLQAQSPVQPFPLGDVRLLPSRFQRNMQRDSSWITSLSVQSLLHSFRNTAGLYSGLEGGYDTVRKLGGWESLDCDLRGHTTGHLLSAMAYLGTSERMRQKADSLVRGLAEVQQQYRTGYLSAFGEGLVDRNLRGQSVWAPFYTLHKILQGLIDQYNLCHNETALTVARGMGDWAYRKLQPLSEAERQRMIRNEFGGFNEAMYNLYAITHDDRHLWVARFFYHNEKIDPLKQGNADLGTYHANTFIPKLLGECRNYELFGHEDSRRAATLLFNTLTRSHAFVTGEVSDHEHLFPPSEQSKHLTGYDGENCCTYNLLKLADRLFCYEPSSQIADYYERALYNHILGQQDTLSSMVCYFTPLQTGAYRLLSTPDSSFWCCVGSGFESHAKYQSSIYFKSQEDEGRRRLLYVNLFIPSEVNWDGTLIRQTTRFPESNKTTLTISGNQQPLTLCLRYPYWATYMKVNGKRMKPGREGYVAVRLPKSSPKGRAPLSVEVEFGMELHQEATNGDSSRVALLYGPIVLGGRLADVPHPFSNPAKHNDYYTFDYGQHTDIPLGEVRHLGGLSFSVTPPSGNGTQSQSPIVVQPFYDLHRCRYVVYWKKE